MSNNDDATRSTDAQEAREALDGVAQARAAAARAATRPTWYYPALGVCLLIAFAGLSLGGVGVVIGVPFGIGVGPAALGMLANKVQGAGPDRSYRDPRTRRVALGYSAVIGVLIVIGVVLEFALDMRWSMAVLGVPALVATIVAGRRMDAVRAARFGEVEHQ